MRVDAATFAKMEADRKAWDFGNKRFAVPALDHLIAMKLHAMKNNPERAGKDGWDIAALLPAQSRTKSCANFANALVLQMCTLPSRKPMTHRPSPDLDLNLPVCSESLPPQPLLSSSAYFALIAEQMAWLSKSGQLERILADPKRQPVDVPFHLD
jgi:hypothetical protein